MDALTWVGLIVGFSAIFLGQVLEGGAFGALFQGTAALIVFGGTIGATLVSTTREDLRAALRLLRTAFESEDESEAKRVADEIVACARIARKESLLALEPRVARFQDPFMKNVFRFMMDGVSQGSLRDAFEAELEVEESKLHSAAKVWLDAGGFAPTIGIIGAVLGLIHVMNNLTDTSKLGSGIAVAFVATIYGVSLSNLVLIPLGNKIKRKGKRALEIKAMIIEGAAGIASGQSPFVIHETIRACAGLPPDSDLAPGSAAPAAAPAPAPANGAGEKASA